MTSPTTAKARIMVAWLLRVLLGIMFLVVGIEKLSGTMGTIPFFDAIGWGQWFRYASGVLDAAGALLILLPRWTFYGALIITCTVGLGTFLCFTKALYNPLFPLVMTLLAATLVWLAWRPKPGLRCVPAVGERFDLSTVAIAIWRHLPRMSCYQSFAANRVTGRDWHSAKERSTLTFVKIQDILAGVG